MDVDDLGPYLMRTTLTVWTPGIRLYSDWSCGGKTRQSETGRDSPRVQTSRVGVQVAETHRVHHRLGDLVKGRRVDVLQLGAVHQRVREVDQSSVINWKHGRFIQRETTRTRTARLQIRPRRRHRTRRRGTEDTTVPPHTAGWRFIKITTQTRPKADSNKPKPAQLNWFILTQPQPT